MRHALTTSLCLALMAGPVLSDSPKRGDGASKSHSSAQFDWDEELPDISHLNSFEVLPLGQAYALVQTRFMGRLIAARLTPPTRYEHQRGTDLAYELRLLTPRRDVLLIRLDARTGKFLEIVGAGLTHARRQSGD